jgi:hypothetical protein
MTNERIQGAIHYPTPQEQIAGVRSWTFLSLEGEASRDAVCDLAERGLLTDDEAEAVRRDLPWLTNYERRMVELIALMTVEGML